MVDPGAEARIRNLKHRLELEPGSRLFVSLAEEYRKAGRLADALLTLQKGLLTHPHYVSAQVALGRAYLETGLIAEAIATFSKVLLVDRGNLVSAKSLADIYLSRGESVEAVKKYKLYRALSGDRNVDDIIEQLEREHAPPPPGARAAVPPPPPPTFYEQKVPAAGRRSRTLKAAEAAPPAPAEEPFDMTPMAFEPEEPSAAQASEPDPFPVVSRDLPLFAAPQTPAPPPAPEQDVVTRALRMTDILAVPPAPAVPGPTTESSQSETATPAPVTAAAEPQGRALADLYFAQGHYAEALRIYDDLAAANPSDSEVKRLRRDAEARLLPAGSTPGAGASDPALERRLARIRALKRWLSVVQTG
jgi:tetratricopeptide (TPR) repeat protein